MDKDREDHIRYYQEYVAQQQRYSAPPPPKARAWRSVIFFAFLLVVGALVATGIVIAVVMLGKKSNGKKVPPVVVLPSPPPPDLAAGRFTNYSGRLPQALLFFDCQKSGRLPRNNPIPWRRDSGLEDGVPEGIDLTGGYYDAGDHIKFVFPMAFSMTTLAWSIIEYPESYKAYGATAKAMENLKWGMDWLLKAWIPAAPKLVAGVGSIAADHKCLAPPELMNTTRPAYFIDTTFVGTDLAYEAAAAFSAAALAFKVSNPNYASQMSKAAEKVFQFAFAKTTPPDDAIRHASYKRYSDNFADAKAMYPSSDYTDEALWGAAWYHRMQSGPISEALTYASTTDFIEWTTQEYVAFSWDEKMLGAQLLLLKAYSALPVLPAQMNSSQVAYRYLLNTAMCKWIVGTPLSLNNTYRTPGVPGGAGLLFLNDAQPNQYAAGAAFLASVYADFLEQKKETFTCGNTKPVGATQLRAFARGQLDYMLGANPLNMSYMVGFGPTFPQQPHNGGAAFPATLTTLQCPSPTADQYLNENLPNPNLLVGALVGGPDKVDRFNDTRTNYKQTEATIAMQSLFLAALASVGKQYL